MSDLPVALTAVFGDLDRYRDGYAQATGALRQYAGHVAEYQRQASEARCEVQVARVQAAAARRALNLCRQLLVDRPAPVCPVDGRAWQPDCPTCAHAQRVDAARTALIAADRLIRPAHPAAHIGGPTDFPLAGETGPYQPVRVKIEKEC